MREALRNYLALASGLTEVGRTRANAAVRAMVQQGEATAGQASGLADDLLHTSRSNRETLANLVRYEVERTLGRLGLATAEDVRALTDRLTDIDRRLQALAARSGPAGAAGGGSAPAGPAGPAATKAAKKAAKGPAKRAQKAPAKQAAKKAATNPGRGGPAAPSAGPGAGPRRGGVAT